ncbi:DNA (cytosine-5)-methyltransferase DRM2-like [Diospyros lotus]|uniref:DNA (cytosine-5)-methyltransferase DRM2-like n=1 Tax=Diospyros lotus TaxID=55363 RepID=UPI002256FBF9|nr:DNA (cytosine-5)-methyltransferase DRM2-like [Diospyros lotus]XP_052196508.1 DNA (cytosine-5)-methyltransferase DRM2-like [Diospyros lotus]XP_052196509.1 DNA (cytosine-5)-methyltransferase DRM2-like [Diospyros lotus]XP_052196510.1 DNA (cytosine-5)-methyltransferase DRM2-like [Diospyros lotus]XP_052196511.1 DNA (cytosine-5)-methyltransferase DRM2-like [Diospyros lotus]XP_052196512.1 DNA (cytosine-5)-methyltransferase DRM2-like [Diospyros lotus]XP_052196513.1 DNA (cytosine-5)-methyltransfera
MVDGNASGEENDNIDWDTEDELEILDFPLSSCSSLTNPGSTVTNPGGKATVDTGEASSSTGPSHSKLIHHFVAMGFPENLVEKAIKENGEGNTDLILETLLTYSAIESSSEQQQQQEQAVDSDQCSSEYGENILDDLSDSYSWSEDEENTDSLSDKDKTLLSLANMGYTVEEASIAMDRCGPHASIGELTDFICAAQMAKAADPYLPDDTKPKPKLIFHKGKPKRKLFDSELLGRKRQREIDDEAIHLPNPMIGYGVPTETSPTLRRSLPEAAIGPPYFYYENVALAPKGVWDTIKRFLYDVEPEFVDSKYFCASARKRGYVHNLPVENRFPLVPLPPRTIYEAFPLTRRWWPSWDTRTKLNCIQTCIASAKLTDRIRKALEEWDDEPPLHVQKYVLDQCRKWNLVWVGRCKVAPLEPDEVEMLLGFPRNHTRGGGISRTDRYKSLGNSFQVDTVAYHFSVLKEMFPGGINLLSLFSGIGGAEVALHRLGIPLKTVVSVEISEVNRNIVRSWWEQTNQKGKLIDFEDVQQLNGDRLEQIINSVGGFDLVVGGSPCNNLTGSNRYSRDGLEGKDSALFYDYFRILDLVKCIMGK